MPRFRLSSEYKPKGDQINAISQLVDRVRARVSRNVLLGVTGSGKTFTLANVIEAVQRPTLVISHNKTLAAQLYSEFRGFFPDNAVEYFVSYYDYYQPEAYIPQTDTYIEKDSSINEDIDRMRHSATRSLLDRRDVVVVASVSCIYALGSPAEYLHMSLIVEKGNSMDRKELLRELVNMQYTRNDIDFKRGTFRVRGDVIEVYPAYADDAVRICLFGNDIEQIDSFDPLRGAKRQALERITIYPNSHYVLPQEKMKSAIESIRDELKLRLEILNKEGHLLEAQRLEQRTLNDIEMIEAIGYCHGIENYSRHLDGRRPGDAPNTLLDYYPDDLLIIIDESHVTIPQLRSMLAGDRSRKKNLIEYGFRLPSSYDNRPLSFEEFCDRAKQVIYVSATPGEFEMKEADWNAIEQIIRPTGLMDPEIIVRPASNQVEDLLSEIKKRVEKDERILVTTLTKRMAEDLTEYYSKLNIKVRYLHSEIDTILRTEILRDLRIGRFDCLIGVNLLREGLDLPEVSLVAIMDADKEGFLRSTTSLIQTSGRVARNINGQVIMYADQITNSMRNAINETNRRRRIQMQFNKTNNITPESIKKSINNLLQSVYEADYYTIDIDTVKDEGIEYLAEDTPKDLLIKALKEKMETCAKELRFEEAAIIRDEIARITSKKHTNIKTSKKGAKTIRT